MPRHLTKEIFTEDGTIDGIRLNRAIRQIIDQLNKVDRGYVAEKWTETKMVRNYIPDQRSQTLRYPWLRAYNTDIDIFAETGDSGDISNEHREKSYSTNGMPTRYNNGTPKDVTQQHIWSETFYFNQPAILVNWNLLMRVEGLGRWGTPTKLVNDWLWSSNPPDGESVGDPHRDFAMTISVDSPLDLGDRSMSDLVAVQHNFSMADSQVSHTDWPATGWATGYPTGYLGGAFPAGALKGMYRDIPLYLPIHAGSRVRLSLVIPWWSISSGPRGGWDYLSTFDAQMFNQVLHVLEPIENGKD